MTSLWCLYAASPRFEYLCDSLTASIVGFVLGILVGLVLCHFNLIRLNKGKHR